MTCPNHGCELAECAMWAEIARIPACKSSAQIEAERRRNTYYYRITPIVERGDHRPTAGQRSVAAQTPGSTPAGRL